MPNHTAVLAKILERLGQDVPNEDQLKALIHDALTEVKTDEGLDPEAVKYKLALVPVDRTWVDETFGKTNPSTSRWAKP